MGALVPRGSMLHKCDMSVATGDAEIETPRGADRALFGVA